MLQKCLKMSFDLSHRWFPYVGALVVAGTLSCKNRSTSAVSEESAGIGSLRPFDEICIAFVDSVIKPEDDSGNASTKTKKVCDDLTLEALGPLKNIAMASFPQTVLVGDRRQFINTEPGSMQIILLKQIFGGWIVKTLASFEKSTDPYNLPQTHVSMIQRLFPLLDDPNQVNKWYAAFHKNEEAKTPELSLEEKKLDVAQRVVFEFAQLFFTERPLDKAQEIALAEGVLQYPAAERAGALMMASLLHPNFITSTR